MTTGSLLLAASLILFQDDVGVTATLDRHQADVGETVVLTVSIQAATSSAPEIGDLTLDGLEVIATEDRSSFRFSPAAGAIREVSREYTLRIERAGQLSILPITVSIDGRRYETEALSLTARESTAIRNLPLGLEPSRGEEVAVRLWVEPETAYVGQQVTLTVAAFFEPFVRDRLQRQPEYRPPDVLGFWTWELPGPQLPLRRTVGNRQYFVQIFHRALFPLTPGRFQIPPASVIYEMRRGLIYAPETFHVESAPAVITVLAAPAAGKPPNFAGAVGRYDVDVSFDRADVAAGEAVNLTLEVSGEGNILAFPRPEFPELPGVRVYVGAEEAETKTHGTELAGRKTFSWVLIPERGGSLVVPAIDLPYFDPSVSSYRELRTEPLTLDVAEATAVPVAMNRGAGALRFLKDAPAGETLSLHRKPGFWIALAVPFVIAFGASGIRGLRSARAPRGKRRLRRRRGGIAQLRDLAAEDNADFFGALRARVLGYLEGRLLLRGLAERGTLQTQHALEDVGVPPRVALDLTELLEACNRYRYSQRPADVEKRYELLEKAEALLATIDREAVSEKRLGPENAGGGSSQLLLIGLLAVTSLPLSTQNGDDVDALFADGVAAYSRGDNGLAAELFERALNARPNDPFIQYNLANAFFGLGDQGHAVALWMNSLRLRPRDPDARYNLLLTVGDDPVLASALQPLPLSDDELALLLAIAWFVACGAYIARFRWRSSALTAVAIGSLLIASVAGFSLLVPRPEFVVVVSREASLRAGPAPQSETLARPAPGTGYRVEQRRGRWLLLSRVGEREGWMEEREIQVVGRWEAGTVEPG